MDFWKGHCGVAKAAVKLNDQSQPQMLYFFNLCFYDFSAKPCSDRIIVLYIRDSGASLILAAAAEPMLGDTFWQV